MNIRAVTGFVDPGWPLKPERISEIAKTLMAAREGLIGIMTADSGRAAKSVAPFGGREARLGTNPICIAMPSNLEGPMFIDMATSAVAAGKLSVAIARNAPIPEGWLLDKDGNQTTNPGEEG